VEALPPRPLLVGRRLAVAAGEGDDADAKRREQIKLQRRRIDVETMLRLAELKLKEVLRVREKNEATAIDVEKAKVRLNGLHSELKTIRRHLNDLHGPEKKRR